MTDDQLKVLRKLGFVAVCIVAKNVSVALPGSVTGAFKYRKDADRFASKLNLMYGNGAYEGRSIL